MRIKNRSLISKYNGKKGGRPKQDSEIRIELPNIKQVILTPSQYGLLLERYGFDLLNRALYILDNWLINGGKKASKYIGKNNYSHFRIDGWVINTAKNEPFISST